jgi:hypothetical protein
VTDLKRTIAGVAIYADTADPAKAERVKRVLDQAMRILDRERRTPVGTRKLIDALFRGGPVR